MLYEFMSFSSLMYIGKAGKNCAVKILNTCFMLNTYRTGLCWAAAGPLRGGVWLRRPVVLADMLAQLKAVERRGGRLAPWQQPQLWIRRCGTCGCNTARESSRMAR